MKIFQLFQDQLSLCKSGDKLALWTVPNLDRINGYRRGTIGGRGLVLQLLKKDNPAVSESLARGFRTWIEIDLLENGKARMTIRADSDADILQAATDRRAKVISSLSKPLKQCESRRAKVRTRSNTEFVKDYKLIFVPNSIEYFSDSSNQVEFLIPPYGASVYLPGPADLIDKILRTHFNGGVISATISDSPVKEIITGNYFSTWNEFEVEADFALSP